MNIFALTSVAFGKRNSTTSTTTKIHDPFLGERDLLDPLLNALEAFEPNHKNEAARQAWGNAVQKFFQTPQVKSFVKVTLNRACANVGVPDKQEQTKKRQNNQAMQDWVWANILDNFDKRLASYRNKSQSLCHGNFLKWLQRVIINEANRYRENESSHKRRAIAITTQMVQAEEGQQQQSHPHGPQEDAVEGRELILRFQKIIEAHMNKKQGVRDPFYMLKLHAIDGIGPSELPKMLGIPEGTVKSGLFRARRILKKEIKPDGSYIVRLKAPKKAG